MAETALTMIERDAEVIALRDALADEHAGRCADQLDLTAARALLAEQTARAEHEHAEMQKQARLAVDWMIDAQRALVACAEMRAALESVMRAGSAMHEQECNQDPCTCWVVEARVALARPDLGAGVVVVPREVVERWAADVDQRHVITAEMRALLKKGGG
jgi:hypothetical protein